MQLRRSEVRGSINLSSLNALELQILRLDNLQDWTNLMTIVSKNKIVRSNGKNQYYTNRQVMQGIKSLVTLRLLERR